MQNLALLLEVTSLMEEICWLSRALDECGSYGQLSLSTLGGA